MNNPEAAEFVCNLEGMEVTLNSPSESPLCQTWVIDKKLSEQSQLMTQQEVTEGLGISFAAAKFLCHLKEDPSKKAFMWVYLQIPIIGTQYQSSQNWQKQAAKPQQHIELMTLKVFKQLGCDVVPGLLACQEGKQGEDSIVLGGYITYVVWNKVSGEPLDKERFWELDFESRKAIHAKFHEFFL